MQDILFELLIVAKLQYHPHIIYIKYVFSKEMEGEIKIFKNDQIHNLLVGKQPRIGRGVVEKSNASILNRDFTDFSKYPFPDPIEPINSNKTSDGATKHDSAISAPAQTSQYSKLRNETQLLEQVEGYLNVYENNHRRKTLMMHQEYEEHFLQPLSKKLLKKVNGPEYDRYLKARTRAITAFDRQTQMKDTAGKELPEIPAIKYDTQGVVDPVMRFKENANKEKALTTIIAKQTGEYQKPAEVKERDTMDLKKWKILAQTRFYNGTGTTPKGKKIFAQKYADQIDGTDFDGLPEIKVGTKKSYVPSDHNIFG